MVLRAIARAKCVRSALRSLQTACNAAQPIRNTVGHLKDIWMYHSCFGRKPVH